MIQTHAVYVNHRPAFGLSPLNLIQAFHALTTNEEGEGPGSSVDRATLLTMLQEHGRYGGWRVGIMSVL